MSSLESRKPSTTYWRSLAELSDAPEFRAFLESEFPEAVDPGGISRRRWLQIMGASFALAGVGGCYSEPQRILPFAKRPEGRTPGQPQRYATAQDIAGNATGLLVTCVDGRPVKVEGNPSHPLSLGATTLLAQAAVLELYDPDRSRRPVQQTSQGKVLPPPGNDEALWSQYDEVAPPLFRALREKSGAGFCVLCEANSSPTLARLRSQLLQKMPQCRWFEYEPLSDDNERTGSIQAFGKPYRTQFDLKAAKVIVCLDADLLGGHPASLKYAREFAEGRSAADGTMNRLYAVESRLTITGASADHRLPLRSSDIPAFIGRLLKNVEDAAHASHDAAPHSDHAAEDAADRFLSVVAKDLTANRGQCVVVAGSQQPAEVHAAIHRLNAILGNAGKTIRYTRDPDPDRPSHVEAITALTKAMHAGEVETLLILGGNPVYDAPADLDFVAGLSKVKTTIHSSLYRNETSLACAWHVPQTHFLESWGDARAFDGTYSVVQPMIAPLHGGRSWIELLAQVLGDVLPKPDELVRETFREIAGDRGSEQLWRKTVHDGLLPGSDWPDESVPEPKAVSLPTEFQAPSLTSGDIEVVFCRDTSVYDGRFANSGWLQECPDPMTKLTWDNAALLSPSTAKALGVENETLITVSLGERSLTVPAYVMPGQAVGSLSVSLGYGRTAAGHVGGLTQEDVEPVGTNVYPLRTSQTMFVATGASVTSTGTRYRLATTQDHHAIDKAGFEARQQRIGELIREATLDEYREHPDFAKHVVHVPPLESMWDEHKYDGHRWGMSIDLSKCIGCNACVVACQAENNVPVVGKEQVLRGREMHWIRVDRYFKGDADADDVQVAMQPVACHQCELAPCEQVCPVAATVHSHEGLNDMVYNRCVGTRYCANNCPYKVRRFNYFNYHKDLKDPNNEITTMAFNPEVTVRSRGVMEKCTYCVQRIQAGKIAAKNDGREIRDGEIQTACQQACPTQAIAFGDLADKQSEVAGLQQTDRAYAMLAELNVKPRTVYLARIRNPHPELTSGREGEAQKVSGTVAGTARRVLRTTMPDTFYASK